MLPILILVSFVILLSCILDKFSLKSGVPALLLFIGLGMIFGEEGVIKIPFYDFSMANNICSTALIFIMFYGGFGTKWKEAKKIIIEASLLSSFGVFLTALLVALGIHILLHWSWLESFLFGSILSSTDAASVFSILKRKKLGLKENTAPLLEVESGSNDPCSYMMTLICLLCLTGNVSTNTLISYIFLQLGGGFFFGSILSLITRFLLKKLHFAEGLDTLFITGAVIAAYALPSYFNGNGYLSVYIFGILLGNSSFPHKENLSSFYDGVTGLSQMFIFFLLGLLSTPSRLVDSFFPAFLIFLILTFIARPISVFSLLLPFRSSTEKKILVSFAGLRGAASIVFAIMTIVHDYTPKQDIFHIVFCVVLLSMIFQGSFLAWMAIRLKMIDTEVDVMEIFTSYASKTKLQFFEIAIPQNHYWISMKIKDLLLPPNILILNILRKEKQIVPYGDFIIQENDIITFSVLGNHKKLSFNIDMYTLPSRSKWIGKSIQEYGEKKNIFISLIIRKEKAMMPKANLLLEEDDQIYFHKK
ncbi:putative potassium/proton antiporter [Fusobacterium equinum]|mgnify:CR=1 FL=1|uniref:Putative potassium/proton antiporter n=1 Tax=Fusobacterium equinum TaxID=134605 RepID=A0A133NKE1_9FUSO|nr:MULTISPECIES: potassium/proton antiporter [Fusobacterium]KXA16762.1 putative potassium/proton antiporter [Fusobacterium equinum]